MKKINQVLITFFLTLLTILLIKLCGPFFHVVFRFLLDILIPIILGFVVAFLLYPVSTFVNRFTKKRTSIIITFILFILFIVISIIYLGPLLFNQLIEIIEQFPLIVENIQSVFGKYENKTLIKLLEYLKIDIDIIKVIELQSEKIKTAIVEITKQLINGIIIFVISIIFSAYILVDYEKIINWIKCKTQDNLKLHVFLRKVKDTMYAYFKGVLLSMFIVFFISLIVFKMLNLNYPSVLAIIIAITNLIPYVGPYLGGGVVTIIALSSSTYKGVISLIFIVCLQLFESYYLTPKIQSKMIKVKPFLVLLSTIILGKLIGIIGMVISIPILAFFQTFYDIILCNKSE